MQSLVKPRPHRLSLLAVIPLTLGCNLPTQEGEAQQGQSKQRQSNAPVKVFEFNQRVTFINTRGESRTDSAQGISCQGTVPTVFHFNAAVAGVAFKGSGVCSTQSRQMQLRIDVVTEGASAQQWPFIAWQAGHNLAGPAKHYLRVGQSRAPGECSVDQQAPQQGDGCDPSPGHLPKHPGYAKFKGRHTQVRAIQAQQRTPLLDNTVPTLQIWAGVEQDTQPTLSSREIRPHDQYIPADGIRYANSLRHMTDAKAATHLTLFAIDAKATVGDQQTAYNSGGHVQIIHPALTTQAQQAHAVTIKAPLFGFVIDGILYPDFNAAFVLNTGQEEHRYGSGFHHAEHRLTQHYTLAQVKAFRWTLLTTYPLQELTREQPRKVIIARHASQKPLR